MGEPNDQPTPAGVGGESDPASNDDIDTSTFDRMEAPADEDDTDQTAPDKGDGEGGEGEGADKANPDDDAEEIEVDGVKAKVPKALKDAFLRHADYTRKTQELGDQRRAFDEERSTWETQREESRAALPEEHAKVAVLNHSLAALDQQLEQLRDVNWDAWHARTSGLAADDPDKVRYMQYREHYLGLRDRRVNLEDQLATAKTDLQTKEDARLTGAKEAAATALREAMEETGRVLAADIKGWNNEVATATAKFMIEELGAKPAEVGQLTDPRTWKMAHEIMSARATIAELQKALKQHQKADDHKRAQETTPAEKAKGSGGGNARDPATPRGDGLSTEEWMKRRQAQVAKRRA